MKKKLFSKNTLISLGTVILISSILVGVFIAILKPASTQQTKSAAVRSISSEILADGLVTAQNQATLHFQTGGQVSYLPFKEGDSVRAGQTIASLNTYSLQRQLQLAANTYQTTRNNVDQAQENQQAGVIEGQQRTSLDTTNKNGYNSITEVQVISDAVKRIVDNNQLTQNSAQLNVDLANYAVSLATLTSPIDGVITHMDITTPLVTVSPTTSFVVQDPASLVLRTNVSENDIDFISEGSTARINLDSGKQLSGTVQKIFPDKITLSSGETAYQVDILSSDLIHNAKLGQSGTVLITSNTQNVVKLVPTWTVLNNNSIWVESNGNVKLRNVTVGKAHKDMIEVLSGLQDGDQIITNPQSLAAKKYQIL